MRNLNKKLPVVKAIKPKTKVNIQCEDNLEYMRSLRKSSMHLIVTSPPYNIGKEYEKRRPLDIYIEDQAATIAEAVRLLHPKGSICWQVGNHIDDGEVFPLDIILYVCGDLSPRLLPFNWRIHGFF